MFNTPPPTSKMIITRSATSKRETKELEATEAPEMPPPTLVMKKDDELKVKSSCTTNVVKPEQSGKQNPPSHASCQSVRSKKLSSSQSLQAHKKRLELEAAQAKARIEMELIDRKLAADLAELEEEYSLPSETSEQIDGAHDIEKWLERGQHELQQLHGDQHKSHTNPTDTEGAVLQLASAVKELVMSSASQQNTKLISRLSTPKELPTFSGDPKEWLQFEQAFIESTKVCNFTDKENLWRLRKCLRGAAHEAVAGLLISGASSTDVISTLKLQFGNVDVILSRIVSDIKRMNNLSADYYREIIPFSVKIKNYVAAVRVGRHEYLQGMELANIILFKLPTTLLAKWTDYSFPFITTKSPRPRLDVLSDFLTQEAVKISTCSATLLQPRTDYYKHVTQSQLLCRGVSAHKVSGLRAHAPRISFTSKDEPEPHEVRRKSASSRLGSSPRSSIASEDRADGNLALRVPTPRGSVSSTGSTSAGSRLARLLTQGVRGTPEDVTIDTPRRLSWERRESVGQLPRSASIDSVVEAAICARHSEPSQPTTLHIPRSDRAFSLASPVVGRRAKTQRGQAELQYGALLEGCGGELPSLSACAPHPPHLDKATRRQQKDARAQQDKIAQVNIHLHALFAAVEHGYLDKARNILESTDVDVNSLNADGLSPLDVAVLATNRQLARMLMEFGAKEGTQFKTSEALGAHLRRLAREAESKLHEVTGCVPEKTCREDACTRSSAASQAAGTTGCAGGAGSEKDKQAQHWERRVRTLKRLVLGWQQIRVPPAPPPPDLEVCGAHAVTVRLKENRSAPSMYKDPPIVTKFKVEWSSRADFSNVCGCREVAATGTNSGTKVMAAGLTRGRRYFFRAAAGNIKGWGPYTVSVPRSVVPSSWRDVCTSSRGCRGAHGGASHALDALAAAAHGARARPHPQHARHPRKKTATIRQLFTAASKFQKNLRRGVYLACILYHEDKVLVTSEEFLPVIEVDETYPTCIYTDFHWLMKVSCAWDDVKALRSDMEKHTSSSIHFRLKLLTAAAQMQSALCVQDLGQLYHKPLRDSHGTIVLSCVNSVKSVKAVSALNSRWASVSRLRRRVLSEDNTIGELLMASVHEQIAYHQVCRVQLPRGLYLGYLKLQSSVEVVRLVAPARTPNVPPHTRVRDNPHVSAEEWEYLKSQSGKSEDTQAINSITSISAQEKPSESQEMFLDLIASASRRLFKEMEIPIESVGAHRIYDLEVIELNNDVSFIMICPPAEQACSVPGQKEILLQKGDLLSLPIQAFEMIHLQTYHTNILNKYSKLSCVLELDVALAAHSHREAFSCTELQTAKERLTKLEDLQNNLNTVWKAERWLMDLISFARDKDKTAPSYGILLKYILDKTPSQTTTDGPVESLENNGNFKDFLQIPSRDGKITKTSPGRGSWPGPAGNGNHANLHPEFSKSEQQLSLSPRQTSVSTLNLSSSQFLNPEVNKFPRKGSADSQFTQSSAISNNYMSSNSQFDIKSSGGSHTSIGSNRLPPSRSEDTLVLQNENVEPKPRPHSINASASTTSSPLLTVKGYYPGSMISVRTSKGNVSESAQSLSSDSESQSCPITSVPLKIRPQGKHYRSPCNVIASKSMTNVKSDVDFTDTGQEFPKTNLCVKRQPLLETQEDADYNNKVPKTDERREEEVKAPEQRTPDQAGILQVFAAYETGLASGTSLKLHVTPRTSAREVIDLVVKQLNMAAVLKGKSGPVYGPEKLQDFCLVAVIGARERCLRDDFRPLQLQNPWRKGRLYVRLKHDVLAALQHSAKQPAYI